MGYNNLTKVLLQVKAYEVPMSRGSDLIVFISKYGEKNHKNHNFFEFFHLLNPKKITQAHEIIHEYSTKLC